MKSIDYLEMMVISYIDSRHHLFYSNVTLKRKYPDATDFSICSLIGGFFFLRFINPAIVTPQAYMLVDGLPSKHPRRTLTLVRIWHMAHGYMDTWVH